MHRNMRMTICLGLGMAPLLWLTLFGISLFADNAIASFACAFGLIGSVVIVANAWHYLSGVMRVLGDECDGWE